MVVVVVVESRVYEREKSNGELQKAYK